MSIKAAIGIVARLLDIVLDVWQQKMKERDYAKRQKKRHKAAADPGGAFADHFRSRVQSDKGDEETGKAGSDSGAEK